MTKDSDPTSDRWLSIVEAAQTLGITHQAVRKRIKLGRIPYRRNNRDQLVVQVNQLTQPVEQPAPKVDSTTSQPDSTTVALATMLEAIQQERQEAARQLTDQQKLHAAEVDRLIGQVAIERSLWLERLDAAECRAERVEARLDQVLDQLMERKSPWWERLIRLIR